MSFDNICYKMTPVRAQAHGRCCRLAFSVRSLANRVELSKWLARPPPTR